MAQIKKGSGRWAIVINDTKQVSNINVGSEPERRDDQKEQTTVVEVDEEVRIGMIQTGDGFVWPAGHRNEDQNRSLGNNATAGAVGVGDIAKSRGDEVPKPAAQEGPTPQPEDMKPKAPAAKAEDESAKAKRGARKAA